MSSPKKPHIVIFNPDQWRGDVLGHMGNPAAQTPTLDRLVREDAVSFRWAFCQNPVCTPSRCSFMTGWYPHVRGHRTMHHMVHAEWDETNLLRLLKDDGYFVWWGGKNDLVPGGRGFADCCDVKYHATPADFARWGLTERPGLHGWTDWRGEPGSDTYYSFMAGKLDTGGEACYADHDWANVLGAIDQIRAYDGTKPLCLYLPLGYPHPPYGVEEPHFSAIDRAALPPRLRPPPGFAGKAALLPKIAELQGLTGWSEARWDELRATYYGMCRRVDQQLGMLIAALKERGLYDDCALFCFSDHGDYTGDYGIVEKTQNTFEDCLTRVPLVIKPPKGTPVQPRVSEALVELVDFPATVFAMTGINPGYDHFGRDLSPLLAGQTDSHRDAVFCEGGRRRAEPQAQEAQSFAKVTANPGLSLYWPRVSLQQGDEPLLHGKGVMCRTHEWKYIKRLYEDDELYDLRADPGELTNRVADPACAAVLAKLRERVLSWYQETCDVVPQREDSR